MDRRLIVLVGLALAVVGPGDQLVLAQSPTPPAAAPQAPEMGEPPMPAELPAQTPAEPLPPAARMPAPSFEPAPAPEPPPNGPAPRDLEVEKSQGARPSGKGTVPDRGPLPPASEMPGQAGALSAGGAAREADPFVLPPDRLPLGRQSVGLSVDVVAPQVLNINQVATLKIVVRNTGTSDAMGVVVRDQLPDSLTLVGSVPEAEPSDGLLFWRLNTVPAGAERSIVVRVKTVKVGPFDHAATVTMLAGGKSRTIVREPKLKVEQSASTGNVLKGQPVQFKITVTNPGTGPARNVIVQAKLSPGLRHESGEPNDQNLFEMPLAQVKPGERVELETLEADTVQAGKQSCLVVAQSSDVTTSADEARSEAIVTVVEPKLKMTIAGDDKRFTDTIATYNVTLENPGSATVHNALVLVTLPPSGRLVLPPPSGTRWESSTGKLLWKVPQVEPGEKETAKLTFQVRMGGVGFYQVGAVARADGGLNDSASFNTDVHGLADLEFDVIERRRVVDIDDTTAFQIRIKNVGTKEATRILVSARYSKNIKPLETSNGTDDRTEAKFNPSKQLIAFPAIDRLAPGKEVVLGIKVQAVDQGQAKCKVSLMHDDMNEKESLEGMASFKITARR
jgi:uncharacterized repeat protein (TIGR01451 family)